VRRGAAVLLALIAAAAAPCTPASAQEPPPPYPWASRVDSAAGYAGDRDGRVSFAVVSPDGRVRGRNIHARYRSASVVKAMLMVAYLNEPGVRGRSLRRADQELLRPMIVRSDNRAASRIRDVVGNDALVRLARRVRMRDFATSTRSWGMTQISVYDQARFFWRVDRYVPARHRDYARSLLAGVVERQRWGLPRAQPEGWRIFFKGGWLPPRVVHQVALLERDGKRVSIAVLTDGDPSFRYGQATIAGVGERLLERVNEFGL
jgi:hypothetical protein